MSKPDDSPAKRRRKPLLKSSTDAGAVNGPTSANESGRSVIALIRDLQAGNISAVNLAAADRRRCVEHLSAEGYAVPEIAEALKMSERTIHRDRTIIRQENSVSARPEMLGEQVGHLMRQAEITVARLRRIGRDRDTPPQTKVEAERACFAVVRETVGTLQNLGYLPSAPATLVGHLQHQWAGGAEGGEIPAIAELRDDAQRLATVIALSGSADPAMMQKVEKIKQDCDRLELAAQLHAITHPTVEQASVGSAVEVDVPIVDTGDASPPKPGEPTP